MDAINGHPKGKINPNINRYILNIIRQWTQNILLLVMGKGKTNP